MRLAQPHIAASYPPPCGEGRSPISAFTRVFDALWASGVGVAVIIRLQRLIPTPHPNPPPQGGRERSVPWSAA
jgi:hypothetical protein